MTDPATLSTVKVRAAGARTLYYKPNLPEDLVEGLRENPHELVGHGEQLQLHPNRRTVLLRWDGQPYVLKCYREPTLWHAVKHSFYRSRARYTWCASYRLISAGIRTPLPVACVDSPLGELRRDSFLMYSFVEGKTLRWCFQKEPDSLDPSSVWSQLHEMWRRLKEARISLTDTNARNFLVGTCGELWALDLDDTRFHRTSLMTAHHLKRAWRRLLKHIPEGFRAAA